MWQPPPTSRRAWIRAGFLVGVLAFLPFARGLLLGHAFYFRDLSISFFPTRLFQVEGLRHGEARYWNPYVHEGEQVLIPPISYPFDLAQILKPDEVGLSWLLALHVPLAGVSFLLLARGLGASPSGAVLGALVYALGGFNLSMLNLYAYLQTAAWAPLMILALVRAGPGGMREAGWAALLVGLAVSTLGLEVVLQAVIFSLVLGFPHWPPGRSLRVGLALGLGCGLAGATVLAVRDALEGTARAGTGFPTDVVLAHSIHPITFLQVLVADLHGDLFNLTQRWWGQNFFPRGFPYVLSLYLGGATLALAAIGVAAERKFRGRLLALLLAAVVVCLGRWIGLARVVDVLPFLHSLRYPVKAFYTVQLTVAFFVVRAVDALRAPGSAVLWRRLCVLSLCVGSLLVAAPAVPSLFASAFHWFAEGFFPPGTSWPVRMSDSHFLLGDAAIGGVVTLAVGLVALLCASQHLRPGVAAIGIAVLIGGDLLRTGVGLNPMVSEDFYRLSPEMSAEVPSLREGRVFTCNTGESRTFKAVRQWIRETGGSPEAWTFAVDMESLTYNFGTAPRVRTALSPDLTMFVPKERVLNPEESTCRNLTQPILARLRQAGVAHVLSLDTLLPGGPLELKAEIAPRRIAPLRVNVYSLPGALPLWFVARRCLLAADRAEASALSGLAETLQDQGTVLEDPGPQVSGASGRVVAVAETPGHFVVEVDSDLPSAVVVREAFAPGWSAQVDGKDTRLVRAEGRYCAVRIPAGRSRVVLNYRPPHLGPGLTLTLASAAAILGLLLYGRRPANGQTAEP
jgi:hypothetical protein